MVPSSCICICAELSALDVDMLMWSYVHKLVQGVLCPREASMTLTDNMTQHELSGKELLCRLGCKQTSSRAKHLCANTGNLQLVV
jgi:hypothetical protein